MSLTTLMRIIHNGHALRRQKDGRWLATGLLVSNATVQEAFLNVFLVHDTANPAVIKTTKRGREWLSCQPAPQKHQHVPDPRFGLVQRAS